MGFMAQPQPAILPASPLARQGPVKEPQSELTAHWRPDNNPLDPTPAKPQQLFSLRLQPLSSSLILSVFLLVSEWVTDLSLTMAATDFCRFIRNHRLSPSAFFPRLFLLRACVRKSLTNTVLSLFFFFFSLPTEAAVFEFKKKEREEKKNYLWSGTVVFFFFFSLLP